MMDYMEQAQAMRETLIAWRRQLHQHPEVGENLPYTKSFIAQKLTEMGLRYQEIDRSGLSVVLGNPEKGPCMLVRCDMDGLPIEEKTGLPYASANGCMHACGHDMHTAMLLGTAQLLKQRENELCGCVKLLWHPAEETMTGAQLMIAGGVMENPHVDAAMGAHMIPMIPAGLGGYGLGGFGVCMIGKGHVVARAGQRQHSRRANAPAAAGQKHVTHHFFFLFSRSIAKKSCKSACASSSSNPDSITG